MTSREVTRTAIVQALDRRLRPLPYADAFWEGGAAAWGRVDAWSDIDLYTVVEEKKVSDVLGVIEEALSDLSPIQQTYVVTWPPSAGIAQRFYRLRDASPFLLVDLAVLARSAPDKFLEPEVHGQNVVYFDKTGVTEVPSLDQKAFDRKLSDRLDKLKETVEMFHPSVEREIHREHWIEGFDTYRAYVLGPLIEVLRMKHGPLHHDFRTKYVYHELPVNVANRLEGLTFVEASTDLLEKYGEALRWFREVVAELT
ncbi:MAG: hypothetical protein V3W28_05610 [Thermoplasmata archaeon]